MHNLTGPIAVEGAEPGDCLVVDILDGKSRVGCIEVLCSRRFRTVQPFDEMPWGYTGIFELNNGGGLFGAPWFNRPLQAQ